MELEQVKLSVQDENLFGFIYPELPNYLYILSALHTRGAFNSWGTSVLLNDSNRLANEADFETFRVERSQWDSTRYGVEYIFNRGV